MAEESGIEKYVRESKVKVRCELWQCVPLFIVAILLPVLAFYGVLIPQGEENPVWFQRSGALVVIFAVWIEFKLFSINGIINPTGATYSQLAELTNLFSLKHKIASYLAAITAISGTLIWGYGDLIL